MTLLEAIDRQDLDTLEEMLVDDVVFHSPVQTYRGRDLILPLILAIGGIIENVEVTRELDDVTFYTATVEEHPVDGVLVARALEDRADRRDNADAATARRSYRRPSPGWRARSRSTPSFD